MKAKFSASDFADVVLKKIEPANCDVTLQLEPILSDNGFAKAVRQIDEKLNNGIGVTMGGFLSAATDSIMAYAVTSLLNSEQTFASIDLHTTFHRPVLPGTAMVEAKVERIGKRTAYVTGEVFQNDKKCCTSVSSIKIMEN